MPALAWRVHFFQREPVFSRSMYWRSTSMSPAGRRSHSRPDAITPSAPTISGAAIQVRPALRERHAVAIAVEQYLLPAIDANHRDAGAVGALARALGGSTRM